MKKHCENCGEKKYNGACTNCHEEIYIERQYEELNMDVPNTIASTAAKQRAEINRSDVDEDLYGNGQADDWR